MTDHPDGYGRGQWLTFLRRGGAALGIAASIFTIVGVSWQIWGPVRAPHTAAAGTPSATPVAVMGYIDDVDATVAVANNTRKEKSYSSATDARPGDELEIEVAGANLSMTADVALHLDLAIVRTGAGTVDVTSTLSTKSGQQTTSHCLIVAEVGRLPEVRFTPKSRIRFKATNEDGAPVLIPLSVPSGVHLSVDLPLILHNGSAGNFTLTVYVTVAH